jgi:hypothetical protein
MTEEMRMELTGQCLCGNVRYKSMGTALRRFVCHCRDCQRSGGSAFHLGLMVPRDGFSLTGDVRAYRSKGDSGRDVARFFCPTCGSGVFNEIELRPGLVAIKVGTLDEPGRVSPNYELFARSKLPWFSLRDIESFPEMTPANHQPKP